MVVSIWRDYKACFERDPAARTLFGFVEVLLTYSGFHAIVCYRISHLLYRLRIPLIPRLICMIARILTGVEIHPGAKIGPGFFIDHGMGVVIGETSEIGGNVTLFQDVTLGGTGKEKGKRHPTLCDNVVVGAGAKLLGNIRIGENSRVGAGSVVVQSVPPNCTVVGVPAEIVKREQVPGAGVNLEHGDLPDPLKALEEKVEALQKEVEAMEKRMDDIRKNHS
ncbi:MAG: serine O-acetyltransferase [Candidatus Omnitrophica bacterium]|nr:serine O-acetyltransferase [Candidatus Omnitrophota bacterium]